MLSKVLIPLASVAVVFAQRPPPTSTIAQSGTFYNCNTREVWTDAKKKYCCEAKGINCGSSTTVVQPKEGGVMIAMPSLGTPVAPVAVPVGELECCQENILVCVSCNRGVEPSAICNRAGKQPLQKAIAFECAADGHFNCRTREIPNPSKQEYCEKLFAAPVAIAEPEVIAVDEPKMTAEEPVMCCYAATLPCLACSAGVTESQYCNRPVEPIDPATEEACKEHYNCRTREMPNPSKQAFCSPPATLEVAVKAELDVTPDVKPLKNKKKQKALKTPKYLTLNAATSSELTIIWAAPTASKCKTEYSVVAVPLTPEGEERTVSFESSSSETYHTITGLDPDTKYKVMVSMQDSNNAAAVGHFSTLA